MRSDEMVKSMIYTIETLRLKIGGYKKITVLMTRSLANYLYSNSMFALSGCTDDLTFSGYPVEIVNKGGLQYWISITGDKFHDDELFFNKEERADERK